MSTMPPSGHGSDSQGSPSSYPYSGGDNSYLSPDYENYPEYSPEYSVGSGQRGARNKDDSWLVEMARTWGWRAYVVPVLLVVTTWVLVDIFFLNAGNNSEEGDLAQTSTSESNEAGETGPDPAQQASVINDPSELPPGGDYTEAGKGTFRVVGSPGLKEGEGESIVIRYIVEIENGVDTAGYGGDDAVASLVDATLSDPRGWTADSRYRFEHVSEDDDPNLRIRLTSTKTTAKLCGNVLELDTSCRTTIEGESMVVMNEARWVRGADTFEGDLGSYRQYLINHEVGHAIGYPLHQECGGEGLLAPVMMQQTVSLNNSELLEFIPGEAYTDNGYSCSYNPWPYPAVGKEG